MDYLTMICDIKNSRKLENREEVQYRIIDMLKSANQKFASYIAAPFIITVGDEWQGLLKDTQKYNTILSYFHECLREVDFYCGIGIGDIVIHNFELTVNQLDGPSFHKARKAIKLAKRLQCSLLLIQ